MKTQTLTPQIKSLRSRYRNKAKRNAWAFSAGLVIGGIIPAITWDVAHRQVNSQPMLWLVVAGGLAYSFPAVWEWFTRYAGAFKSAGFVLSLEVSLAFTDPYTSIPALVVLSGLNAMILANRFTND